MKILIGTPIHQAKDYAMERWLKNVANLRKLSPSNLLLVDNSPTENYCEKVKTYCDKIGITNYKIQHVDFKKNESSDLRIEYCQELIRQYCLSRNYDAWFSWECDQIIPTNTLGKLIQMMKSGNYSMVIANSRARWDPTVLNTNMGITLISFRCLKKNLFLPSREGKISLDPKNTYDINTYEYKKRVLASKQRYIEVFGIIKPIYHLNQ